MISQFCGYFAGKQVDPAIVAAGHTAFDEATSGAVASVTTLCQGDRSAASTVTETFLLGPADPIVPMGWLNALIAVLLNVNLAGGTAMVVAEPWSLPKILKIRRPSGERRRAASGSYALLRKSVIWARQSDPAAVSDA